MSTSGIISRLKDNKRGRIRLLSDPVISRVEGFVSTQCMPLDLCIGGGIPIGRQVEIYGDTSTAKSLLAAHILAETQVAGGTAVLFDTEATTSEDFMSMVGVDLDSLIYSTPDTIEEMYDDFDVILDAKRKEDPDGFMVMVWDSVAATSSDSEIEAIRKKGLGAATMGVHARTISQLCRIVTRDIARSHVSFIFVNQTRKKIGVLFGSDETTFGGKAIPFYSSVRIKLKHAGKIKDKSTGEIVGVSIQAGIDKNKIAPPFRRCEFDVLFDQGINEPKSILKWMQDRGLVTGSSWKTMNLLDGTEIKFQHRGWEDTFYQNEDAIRQLLLADDNGQIERDLEDE